MKISRERFNQLVREAYNEVINEALDTTTQKNFNKYPIVKKYLNMLHGPNYMDFIESVQLSVPAPTTFKVTVINGQSYELEYVDKPNSEESAGYFVAIVASKRYHLEPGSPEIAQVKTKMKDEVFKTAPMSDTEEEPAGDLGGDDFEGGDDAGADLGADDGGEEEVGTDAPDFEDEPDTDI